ncbi:MAG: phosphoenolpyruvate carboxykinase (GTP) [Candidatus Omnitrophica bacterium]|nr:phosphoenolpyruvate carboxykinase (GTP) [Candidatus Omnitrophota bacterium]
MRRWVEENAALCQPQAVHWCDGTEAEFQTLTQRAIAEGVLIGLNQKELPGCFLHRSQANDTARTEHCTYICTSTQEMAGPTNNWMDPEKAYSLLRTHFSASMRQRTMYVVPFLMGHPGSPLAKVGVELTDSLYVVLNMRIMTRMGHVALQELRGRNTFTRCLHSVGNYDPQHRYICHFPQDNTIWSYGSGYGGNALLGKKCLALRIGSFLGQQEGWLAEHMLIMAITDPKGAITYLTGAFPSACGKTNLAMLEPPAQFKKAGWKVTTLGDDIAWMYVDKERRLRALNPESGYFGVVPGTNRKTNPNAMEILSHDSIFTNVALLPDGQVWWEGKDGIPPAACLDWMGKPWTPQSNRKAAHPNSRFTAPLTHNPALNERWNDPAGVAVSAIILGGRRSQTVPLIVEAFDWRHGVYLGATLGSETTAAAAGQVGLVRRDPMAMLPFCGYHMGRYFAHWLNISDRMHPEPRIFFVNWFRRDENGKFLWPGFGENLRILEWILKRCKKAVQARRTPLGWMPYPEDIDLQGLEMNRAELEKALSINKEEWIEEALAQGEFLNQMGNELPAELKQQHEELLHRLHSP